MDECQNLSRIFLWKKQEKISYFKFSLAAASHQGPAIWLQFGNKCKPKILAKGEMEGTGDHRNAQDTTEASEAVAALERNWN